MTSLYTRIKKKLNIIEVKKFLIIFYIVGLLGFVLHPTHKIFVFLIPYAIILSFVLVLFFHKQEKLKSEILIFTIIFLFGFFIEVLGVNTGKIFGDYYYGDGLGLKIFNTPLLIGINWLMLVYCSKSILNTAKFNLFFKIFLASFVMVAYDIILEKVAPKLDMWHWKGDVIPIQNYIAWSAIAFIMHLICKRLENKNPIANLIFILQSTFFFLLFLYFKFV